MSRLIILASALALGCGGKTSAKEQPVHAQDHDRPHNHNHGHGHGHGDTDHGHGHPDHGHAHAHAHGDPDHAHAHAHDSPKPLGHTFEDVDRFAKRFDDPKRAAWQKPDEVVALMKIDAGATVADIGAGTGYFLPYLSRAVGASGVVHALDIEPHMVEHMKKRVAREKLGNVTPRQVRTDDPQLADGSVDRILIVDTWHHIPEREAYSRKLARALRAGGAVYVVDFTMQTKRGPPPKHRLKPELVIGELKAAGLDASLATETLPDQYVVVARRR